MITWHCCFVSPNASPLHFAVILTSVEMSGVVTVASQGNILHFIENNHLYHELHMKAIVADQWKFTKQIH